MVEKAIFYFWFGWIVVPVCIGGIVVSVVSAAYRGKKITNPNTKSEIRRFPPAITGALEGLVFSLLIGAEVGGCGVAMFAWIAAKQLNVFQNMASIPTQADQKQKDNLREWNFSAIVFSLLNMMFAIFGGLLISKWRAAEFYLPLLKILTDELCRYDLRIIILTPIVLLILIQIAFRFFGREP